MPRSKRKAVAARAAAKGTDFVKKKTKLGKRTRSDTLVDASAARSRKIYLPPPEKGNVVALNASVGATGKSSGVRRDSLAELVVRARHYNTHARATALTAMARIFSASEKSSSCRDDKGVTSAAAVIAEVPDAAPVLRVGFEALQDDEAGVRIAANLVVISVLRRLTSIRPFSRMIAAQLCAALSHIRVDVRVAGARAVCSIFQLKTFHAAEIFDPRSVNPLPLLTGLLRDITTHKARSVVASAIAVLSSWSRAQDTFSVEYGRESNVINNFDGLLQSNAPFYYHCAQTDRLALMSNADPFATLPLLMLSADAAASVVVDVANLVAEYLPMYQSAGDSGQRDALLAAARALSTVVCDHSLQLETADVAVERVVKAWSDEQVDGPSPTMSALAIDVSMAEVALVSGAWAVVGRFLTFRMMGEDGVGRVGGLADSNTLDELAERVMRVSPEDDVRRSVMAAWMTRWTVVSKDLSRVGGCVDVLRYVVLSRLDEARERASERGAVTAWRVVAQLPGIAGQLMEMRRRRRQQRQKAAAREDESDDNAVSNDDDDDGESDKLSEDGVDKLLALVCEVCRTHGGRAGFEAGEGKQVGAALAQHVMKSELISELSSAAVLSVLSGIFYCGHGLSGAVVELLARCSGGEDASLQVHGVCIAWMVEACLLSGDDRTTARGADQHEDEQRLGALAGALTCGLGALRHRDADAATPLLASVARVVRASGVDVSSVEAVLCSSGANEDEMKELRERCFGDANG
jgi:hypothetical protein